MQDAKLTYLEKFILGVITKKEWISRTEIGEALQRTRNKLTNYDIALINGLVEQGLVEVEQRTHGIAQFYFVYRAKGNKS